MDMGTSFGYTNDFSQQGLRGMSVAGVLGTLSNGVTINEPDPDRPPATMCLQMLPEKERGK